MVVCQLHCVLGTGPLVDRYTICAYSYTTAILWYCFLIAAIPGFLDVMGSVAKGYTASHGEWLGVVMYCKTEKDYSLRTTP